MTDVDLDDAPVPGADVVEAVDDLIEATRAEHAEAVDALAAPLEDALVEALRRVWAEAMRRVGLVAAGNPDDLGRLVDEWTDEVREITPYVGEVYGAGALGAWQQHEAAAARAALDPALDPRGAVDLGAVERMAGAQNRMVNIGDEAWADARSTLARGIDEGWDIERTTAEMEDRLNVHEGRARTVARTETIAAANGGSMDGVRALGRYGPRRKRWLAAWDSRTRDSHRSADGQTQPRDRPFEVGGARLQYPGDPTGPAREVVNCRCTILWEETGTEVLPEVDDDGNLVEPDPTRRRSRRTSTTRPAPDPADTRPPLPDPEPDPPRFLTPEEEFRRDVADHRDALRADLDGAYDRWVTEQFPDPDAYARVRPILEAEARPGDSGLGRLIADLAEEGGDPSPLLRSIEQRTTEFGRRVDGEVERRLSARGITRPDPPLTADERQAILQRRRRLEHERADLVDDWTRELIDNDPKMRVADARRQALARRKVDPRYRALRDEDDALLHRLRGTDELDAMADYRDAWSAEFRSILDEIDGTGLAPSLQPGINPRIPKGVTDQSKRALRADEAQAVADAVADVYPRRWVRLSDEAGEMSTGMSADGRGWQWSRPGTNSDGMLSMSESYRPGSAEWDSLAVHEFGHRMEHVVPGIRELEFAFYRRRTAGESARRLSDLIPGSGYRPDEVARPDRFAVVYSGKEYGGNSRSPWELFTMAAETYLPHQTRRASWSEWGAAQFVDDDMRRWFAGVMLSGG